MHIMYIYNLLETDFANKVCMKNNCAYHVRLLKNFHSRTINQTRDVGGSSTLPNSEGTHIAMRSNGLQPQVGLKMRDNCLGDVKF